MRSFYLIFATLFILPACTTVDKIASSFDKTAMATKNESSPIAKKEQTESAKTKVYRDHIKKCDNAADYDLEFGDLTTAGMDTSVDKQISCYKSVAYQIIDKYYSEQSEKMKQRLNEYIKYSYKISIDIYELDSCTPACGTMTTGMAYYKVLQNIKKYMDDLFWVLDNWD